MSQTQPRLVHVVRMTAFILVSSGVLIARAEETTSAKFDDRPLRQRLDALRERLGRLNPLNPFGGAVQPAPGMPRIVIPPAPQQPPEFFMRKVPVTPQDRSNWVPRTINGQTFYLVPCRGLRAADGSARLAPTTAPSAG